MSRMAELIKLFVLLRLDIDSEPFAHESEWAELPQVGES